MQCAEIQTIYLPFEFPVESGKKLKVSFYARDNSSFDGYFGQAFAGTFNQNEAGVITGSISQSNLTTSWVQYQTISPPMSSDTVVKCYFICSGSAGYASIDQISASYI